MDLATRIRQGLAEGKPPEIVVSELMAGGMTEATARRLVDRALSQPLPPPSEALETVSGDDDHDDASDAGRMSLIVGSFFASLGVAITAFTYVRARPGQEFIITYGMVFAGLATAGKGLQAWWKAGARGFPIKGVTLAAVFPIVVFFGPMGWFAWRESTRVQRELAAQVRAEEAAAEAATEAAEAALKQRIASETAALQRAAPAYQMMMDGNPTTRCAGARIMGELKLRDVSTELFRLAETDPEPFVRDCAKAAIAAIAAAHPDLYTRPPQSY